MSTEEEKIRAIELYFKYCFVVFFKLFGDLIPIDEPMRTKCI